MLAGVSISDGYSSQVNQLSVYRFTIVPSNQYFDSGTTIITSIPTNVQMELNSQGQVPICRSYNSQSNTTSNLAQCSYDNDSLSVSFQIPSYTSFGVTYQYEIGYIQNPSISTIVSGFEIMIFDPDGNELYDSMVSGGVYIQPGNIQNQTLTESSSKVSATCTYTFSFQISDPVPGNGQIIIVFPSQISVPTGLQGSQTQVNVYGQGWSIGQLVISPTSVTFTNAFGGNTLTPDSTKYIQVQIQNVVNPMSLKATSSFQIQITDYYQNIIDQATTGLTVQPTIPGDIIVYGLAPQTNPQVGQFTDLNFNIQLNQAYQTGGYLLITFPPEVTLQSLTCYPYIGFVTQDSSCYLVNNNPQTVMLNNSVSSQRLFFLISTVQNPSSTKNTSTFTIQAYDSSDYLMSQILTGVSYQATPTAIKSITAIRNLTQISLQTGNFLNLTFTTTNPLVNGDQIYISVPYDQQLVNSSTFSCSVAYLGSTTSPSCSLDTTTNATYFNFNLQAPCSGGCPAASKFSVIAFGIQNPQWKVNPVTKSIWIQTRTSDLLYQKDQTTTGIYTSPALTAGPLSLVSVAQLGNVVNTVTSFHYQVTLLDNIPAGGFIRLYFPPNSYFIPSGNPSCFNVANNNSSLTCTATNNLSPSSGINNIQVSGMCTTQCNSGSTLNLWISSIYTRPSVKTIQNNFTVVTYTSASYLIDSGSSYAASGITLIPANFSSLILSSPINPIITGANAIYTLQITTINGLTPTTGLLQIVLPSQVGWSSITVPICTATSSNKNFGCIFTQSNSTISVINNQTSLQFANTVIQVSINTLKNPETTATSSPFLISTYLLDTNSSIYYPVDSSTSTLTVTPDTPNTLNNVSVTRTNTEINQQSNFVFNFTTTNQIPKNSLIIISLPKDQVIFSQTNDEHVYMTSDTNTQIDELIINGISDAETYYVTSTLLEWCSGSASYCPEATTLSFVLENVFNPSSTQPPTLSFQIKIQTPDGYLTDEKLQDISVSPLLSNGPFTSVSISESSTIVAQSNQITIQITIDNQIPSNQNGSLMINFPSSLYYQIPSPSISCQTDSSTETECTPTYTSDSYGNYISTISINMRCIQLSCSSGQQRTFILSYLQNRYSTSIYPGGNFQLASYDSNNYTYDASVVTFSSQNGLHSTLSPSNTGQIINITRSNSTVSSSTAIIIYSQAQVELLKNSQIQLFIPKDAFIYQSGLSCVNNANNQTVQCQFNSSLETSTQYCIQLAVFCSSMTLCPAQSIYGISLSGFINRYNTKSTTTSISFNTLTSDFYLIETTNGPLIPSNTLQPSLAYIQGSLAFSDVKVGESTTFSFTFNLQNQITLSDSLDFTLSQSILTIADTTQALQVQVSTSTQSSQPIICTTDDQLTNISCGQMPFNVTQGTPISISISNVRNLYVPKPLSTQITIIAYTSKMTQLVAQGTSTFTNWSVLQSNQFTSIALTRNDSDLSAEVEVSLTLSTPIAIPQNSRAYISIAKSQFILPSGTSMTSVFNTQQLSTFTITQDSSFINFTSQATLCSSSDCPSGSYNFTISGLQNPSQISTVINPILFDILSSDNYTIISSPYLQATPSLQINELQSFVINQKGSTATGANGTQYELIFQFSETYQASTLLLLQIPSETITNIYSPLTCTEEITQSTLQCQINQTTNGYVTAILIKNLCSVTPCTQSIYQRILIGNFENVQYQRPRTSVFNLLVLSSSYSVISTGNVSESTLPSFDLNTVTNFQILRSSAQQGANVTLSISFISTDQITSGSILQISIPQEQVLFSSLSAITIKSGASTLNSNITQSNQGTTSYIIVNLTGICATGCPEGANISFQVTGGANPNTLAANSPTLTFQIMIWNSLGYGIENYTGGVIFIQPPIKGIQFSNVLASRSNNMVGAQDDMTFIIGITSTISDTSSVTLYMPNNVAYLSTNGQDCSMMLRSSPTKVQCSSNVTTSGSSSSQKSIVSVTFQQVCTPTNPCNSGQSLILTINVVNPSIQNIPSAQTFQILMMGSSTELGIGTVNLTLPLMIPNVLDVSIFQAVDSLNNTLPCIQAGQICDLTLQITTTNPVPSITNNGSLSIQLPPTMSLNASSNCTVYYEQTQMNCSVSSSSGVVFIYHTLNLVGISSMLFTIDIRQVISPFSTQSSGSFAIQSYTHVSNSILPIDQLQNDLEFQSLYPGNFTSINITRSKSIVNTNTGLSFSIQTHNYLPPNGQLTVTFPPTQLNITSTGFYISCFQTGTAQQSKNTLTCQKVNSTTMTIDGMCEQQNGCPSGSVLQIVILSGVFANPQFIEAEVDNVLDSVIVTSSYTNTTTGLSYLVDTVNQGLFIQPPLAVPSLKLSAFSTSSNNTSNLVTMTFNASQTSNNAYFSGNFVLLTFTTPIYYVDPLYSPTATLNLQQTPVGINLDSTTNAISSLSIQCGTSCQGSSSITISIANIQNPSFIYSTFNTSQVFNMTVSETTSDLNSVISQGSLNIATQIKNLKLSPITNAQLIQSNYSQSGSNTVQIYFTLPTDAQVSNSADLQVILPVSYSENQNGLECIDIMSGYNYQCSALDIIFPFISIANYVQNTPNFNGAVSLQISGIINPKTNSTSPLTIQLFDSNQLYVNDNTSFILQTTSTQTTGCPTGCSLCTSTGTCVQCNANSSTPILQNGQCTNQCLSGYVEENNQCIQCSANCTSCSSYSQCTQCSNNSLNVDGQCKGITTCPNGMVLNSNNQCVYNKGCEGDCTTCGTNKSYCYSCSKGLVSYQGTCQQECPSGMYANVLGQCAQCDLTCLTCEDSATQCSSCKQDGISPAIFDPKTDTCVSQCPGSLVTMVNNLPQCDTCSTNCQTCSMTRDNCTSCLYDKSTSQDLYLLNNQCITECPTGMYQNLETNTCDDEPYSILSLPPMYLISSATVMTGTLVASKFLAGKADNSGNIAIALLTSAEFLNRLMLLGNLWTSTKTLSFCVTGMNILANSLIAVYFTSLVLMPICNQLSSVANSNSVAFKAVAILTQVTGVNTARLLTSNFMGMSVFNSKLNEIPYYTRHLEGISLISTGLSLLQIGTGLSCIFDFARSQDAMGLGVNSIIMNTGLVAAQSFKYYQASKAFKYSVVQQR